MMEVMDVNASTVSAKAIASKSHMQLAIMLKLNNNN